MKIYMSYNQIPEFKDLSRQEISKMGSVYYFKSFLHWRHWLALCLLITCIVIWHRIIEDLLPFLFHTPTSESVSILLLIFWSAFGSFVYYQIVVREIRRLYCRDQNIKAE